MSSFCKMKNIRINADTHVENVLQHVRDACIACFLDKYIPKVFTFAYILVGHKHKAELDDDTSLCSLKVTRNSATGRRSRQNNRLRK